MQPRKCYEDANVRIVNSSLAQLPPTEDAVVVAAEAEATFLDAVGEFGKFVL